MNNLRLLSPGPAQRAANEIRNTINSVADEVREMNGAIQELRADAKAPAESPPQAEGKPPTPLPDANSRDQRSETPATQLPTATKPSTGAVVGPPLTPGPQAPSPPPLALPPVPDFRPQLGALVQATLRNHQMMMSVLRDLRLLFDAHTREIAELREQIVRQQNAMSNMRSF
jgi:hypothetical protein